MSKLWFFLFVICFVAAAALGYNYMNTNTEAQRLNNAYKILEETATSTVDRYNALVTQYKGLSDSYTKLMADYSKMGMDYQKVVTDYNNLVTEYNKLAKK